VAQASQILSAKSERYLVGPVDKALSVLSYIADAREPASLHLVARDLGLPKTTAFRYLCTLEAHGLVVRDSASETYRLGLRMWQLGWLAASALPLRAAATARMRELRDRFNETVNLGGLEGAEVVYLDMAESSHSLRMLARVGARDPVHSTALGKAMVAYLPEDRWEAHLPDPLSAATKNTITSIAKLRTELRLTRERGYAIDRGENEPDSMCIGAPIIGPEGEPLAAISVAAPRTRLPEDLEGEIAAEVVRAARDISEQLASAPGASRGDDSQTGA
jgi:DNA-binding IclR family transcriptional regulator